VVRFLDLLWRLFEHTLKVFLVAAVDQMPLRIDENLEVPEGRRPIWESPTSSIPLNEK
jgi:hypothetical protein